MEALLKTVIPVTDTVMRQLALQRGLAVGEEELVDRQLAGARGRAQLDARREALIVDRGNDLWIARAGTGTRAR